MGTYKGLIISACSFSRIMWQSISMCFVHSWKKGFVAMYKVVWLSQNNGVGTAYGTFKSDN